MPAVAFLPDITLVVVAMVLVAIGGAMFLLRDLLTGAFSHVPVIGGWIASSLGGFLNSAGSAVVHYATDSFGAGAKLFDAVALYFRTMFDTVIRGVFEVSVTAIHIAETQIPKIAYLGRLYARQFTDAAIHDLTALAKSAVSYAEKGIAAAEHYAASEFDTARHDIAALSDSVARTITADFNIALQYADNAVAQLWHNVTSLTDQLRNDTIAQAAAAEAYALSLFRTAEADAAREVAAAEATLTVAIDTAVKGIVTDLDTWGNQAVSEVWPDASGDIEALKQVLGDAFPDISSLLKFLEGAGAAGLLGALIRSLAGTAAVTRIMDECVVPSCENLSQLGRDLKELASVPAAAAMLGWLVFIATDPVTAADDTVTVAAPFLDTVFAPLAGLLSAGAQRI